VLGLIFVLASQEMFQISDPDLALPRWITFYGCAMSFLLSSAVRMWFPPVADQLQGANVPAQWLKQAGGSGGKPQGDVRVIKIIFVIVTVAVAGTWMFTRAASPKIQILPVLLVLLVAHHVLTAKKGWDLLNLRAKVAIFCAVLICVAGVLWMATAGQRSLTMVTYSQFLERVRTGRIASVIVMGSNSGATEAICRLKNGNAVRTVLPSDYRDALVAMQDNHVDVEIRDSASGPLPLFVRASPFFLLLGVWIFLMIRKFPNGLRRGFPG
jgi:hypothetical protein